MTSVFSSALARPAKALRRWLLKPDPILREEALLCRDERCLRAERLLDVIQAERLERPFDLEAFLSAHPQSLILTSSQVAGLDAYFAGHTLFRPDSDLYERLQCDLIVSWKYSFLYKVMDIAEHTGRPLVFLEDAFLKSVLTAAERGEERFKRNHAFFVDDLGYYFDATRVSRLELMLNDPHLVLSETDRRRGAAIRKLLVDKRLTKYNHQPTRITPPGRPGAPKVLVVDQARNDASVGKGLATAQTFQAMLAAALEQNPDADVIVKRHPDAIAKGGRFSYFAVLPPHERIFSVTAPVNPYTLLEYVDKVYVCSSMLGLEALMAGKETHVFGMPCYAGWGLTVDYQRCPRRTRVRELDELVFIIYTLYTQYVGPEGKRIQAEEAIHNLVRLRDEYFTATKGYSQ